MRVISLSICAPSNQLAISSAEQTRCVMVGVRT